MQCNGPPVEALRARSFSGTRTALPPMADTGKTWSHIIVLFIYIVILDRGAAIGADTMVPDFA